MGELTHLILAVQRGDGFLPAGHDQIHADFDGQRFVCPILARGKPVSHDDAIKAPFAAQKISAELTVIGTVGTVDLVVGDLEADERLLSNEAGRTNRLRTIPYAHQ